MKIYYTEEDVKFAKTIVERVSDNCNVIINGNIQETVEGNNGLNKAIEQLKNSNLSDNSSMIALISQLNDF